MRRVAVLVRTREPERAAEALRAAVGLTLRGDAVILVTLGPLPEDPRIARALGTLRSLGHRVEGTLADLGDATAVEVWS